MKQLLLFTLVLIYIVTSCKPAPEINPANKLSAQSIFNATNNAHGASTFDNALINLNVGTTNYAITSQEGRALYTMTRYREDNVYKATYDGGLLTYAINDSLQKQDSYPYQILVKTLYGFVYCLAAPFSFRTNDVILKRNEDVVIRTKNYYVIDVTFTEVPDTPKDHFILYVNQTTNIIDYIALEHELTTYEPQFRRMINPRIIDGVLFQDYIQFIARDENLQLEEFYTHYNTAQLKDTRTVELTDIVVTPKTSLTKE